jgi:hypothetical protein
VDAEIMSYDKLICRTPGEFTVPSGADNTLSVPLGIAFFSSTTTTSNDDSSTTSSGDTTTEDTSSSSGDSSDSTTKLHPYSESIHRFRFY